MVSKGNGVEEGKLDADTHQRRAKTIGWGVGFRRNQSHSTLGSEVPHCQALSAANHLSY